MNYLSTHSHKSVIIRFFLLFFFFISANLIVYAQPSNDNCNGAINLGILPTPRPCTDLVLPGVADTASWTFSNVGATGTNPYQTVLNCDPIGNTQNGPAADVWFEVTLTGNELYTQINSSLSGINVAYFLSDCSNLVALGCYQGGPNIFYDFQNVLSGSTILIQISGVNLTDVGTFTLTLSNHNSCFDCLIRDQLTASPPPTFGTYAPNQTVTFTYEIFEYNRVNSNWQHGVEPVFGNGWDVSTLSVIPPASKDGAGVWSWYGADTSSATSMIFGSGFYYDSNLGGPFDGTPGNNFGDNAGGVLPTPWTYVWTVTTKDSVCTSLNDLSIGIRTHPDGISGSWSNIGCLGDAVIQFSATMVCCPYPTLSTFPSCINDSTGYSIALGQGTAPFDYYWLNSLGDTIQFVIDATTSDTLYNLKPGLYTIIVNDFDTCSHTVDFFIDTLNESYFSFADSIFCLSGSDPIPDSIFAVGGNFFTNSSTLIIDSLTGQIDLSSAFADTTYTILYAVNLTCGSDTSIFQISFTDTFAISYFSYPSDSVCANGINPIPDSLTSPLQGFFSSSNPSLNINSATGEIFINPALGGTADTIFYITSVGCNDTSFFVMNFLMPDNPYISYDPDTFCFGSSNPTPDSIAYPGGIFTILSAFATINTSTGIIDMSTLFAGTYYSIQYLTDSICPALGFSQVYIRPPNSSFQYSSPLACNVYGDPIPSYILYGGGSFWCNDTSLVIDSLTGQIDISSAVIGTPYTIFYAIDSFCVDTSTYTITAIVQTNPYFTYPQNIYCWNATNPLPDSISTSGGVFSAIPVTSGLTTSTGLINLSITSPGIYDINYFSPVCPDTSSFTIEILPADTATFSYSPSSICIDDSIVPVPVVVQPGGVFSYFPSGLSMDTLSGTINIFTCVPDQTYSIVYTTPAPCSESDTIQVYIEFCYISFFNNFTPNGDGINDIWYIPGITNYPSNSISILNRWGDMIWKADNYDNTSVFWDGKSMDGNELPLGTYYYVLDLFTGIKYTGFVEITK